MGPSRTVLIVDDSAEIRRELCEEFTRSGFIVCAEAENGCQAIEMAREYRPDLIILDLSMPLMNGLQAAPELRKIAPETAILLYTAFADAVSASDLKANGVDLTLPKSEPLEALIATAERLLFNPDFAETADRDEHVVGIEGHLSKFSHSLRSAAIITAGASAQIEVNANFHTPNPPLK